MNWKNVSCNDCKSKRYCRKRSIGKGSKICQQNRGLLPRKDRGDEQRDMQRKISAVYGWLSRGKQK